MPKLRFIIALSALILLMFWIPSNVLAKSRAGNMYASGALSMDRDSMVVWVSDTLRIEYRLGHRYVDTTYKANSVDLQRFISFITEELGTDRVEKIVVHSYASPDGSNRHNIRLSGIRTDSLASWIQRNTGISPEKIEKRSGGIGWDILRDEIAASDIEHKDEVLDIIDRTPDFVLDAKGNIVTGRKKKLMDLRGGRVYNSIKETVFPSVRAGKAVLYFRNPILQERSMQLMPAPSFASVLPYEAPVLERPMLTPTQFPPVMPDLTCSYRWALKTNLLYYAILMPSLELEYAIDRNWSVAAVGDLAWWSIKPKHKYYQVAVIYPEARWWFKTKDYFHGHYLGVFAGGTWYDLENGGRGYKGEGGFAGISYGYMFPITKHLSFDAEIGAGYLFTEYEEYLPVPYEGTTHYVYQQTSRLHYFGPLKLKFSLAWRFGAVNKSGRAGK